MKKLNVVLLAILAFTVSTLYFAAETGEIKESKQSDYTPKNLKPKQGDKFTNSIGMEFGVRQ